MFADFARTLERELTDMTSDRDHWQREMGKAQRTLERELAEAQQLEKSQQEMLTSLDTKCAELEQRLANVTTERDKLHRRMEAMFPLFQEARDALTAIPLASAKLRGIDLTLGDRMDDVGIPERWNASEERKALEAPK